jgi:thiamine biosynthesis protein ThiS
MMEITLNNRPESFDKEQLSVAELLDIKNYTFKMLVIKVNGKLVKKESYPHFIIKTGDDVSVLHLVSGG